MSREAPTLDEQYGAGAEAAEAEAMKRNWNNGPNSVVASTCALALKTNLAPHPGARGGYGT